MLELNRDDDFITELIKKTQQAFIVLILFDLKYQNKTSHFQPLIKLSD